MNAPDAARRRRCVRALVGRLLIGDECGHDQNVATAFEFATYNLAHHDFLDCNERKLDRVLQGLCTKLVLHNLPERAERLQRCIDEFIGGSNLNNKHSILSLLLFLSHSPVNLRAVPASRPPPIPPDERHLARLRNEEDARSELESLRLQEQTELIDSDEEVWSSDDISERSQPQDLRAKESDIVCMRERLLARADRVPIRRSSPPPLPPPPVPSSVCVQALPFELVVLRDLLLMLNGIESDTFRLREQQKFVLANASFGVDGPLVEEFCELASRRVRLDAFVHNSIGSDRSRSLQSFACVVREVLQAQFEAVATLIITRDDCSSLLALHERVSTIFTDVSALDGIVCSLDLEALRVFGPARLSSVLLSTLFAWLSTVVALADDSDLVRLSLFCFLRTFAPYLRCLSATLHTRTDVTLSTLPPDFFMQRRGKEFALRSLEEIPEFLHPISQAVLDAVNAVELATVLNQEGVGSRALSGCCAKYDIMQLLTDEILSLSSTKPEGKVLELDQLRYDEFPRRLQCPALLFVERHLLGRLRDRCRHMQALLLDKLADDCDLVRNLQLYRAFYFMECGDITATFAQLLFDAMESGSEWCSEYALSSMMQSAIALSVHPAKYESVDIVVSVVPFDAENKHHQQSPESRIRLSFEAQWPLSIIVNEKHYQNYNKVFSFLLQVKRAKSVLERMLRLPPLHCAIGKRFLHVRWKLHHFVNNLHNYVLNRTVDHGWSEFIDALTSASTLKELCELQSQYLEEMLRNLLLADQASVALAHIREILHLSLRLWTAYTQRNTELLVSVELDRIESEFEASNRFLLIVLSQISKRPSSQLKDALLCLNYNSFYTLQ